MAAQSDSLGTLDVEVGRHGANLRKRPTSADLLDGEGLDHVTVLHASPNPCGALPVPASEARPGFHSCSDASRTLRGGLTAGRPTVIGRSRSHRREPRQWRPAECPVPPDTSKPIETDDFARPPRRSPARDRRQSTRTLMPPAFPTRGSTGHRRRVLGSGCPPHPAPKVSSHTMWTTGHQPSPKCGQSGQTAMSTELP